MRKAIYPGTFDPFTNGHLDILERSLLLFDEVVVLVSSSSKKRTLFSVEERVEMIREIVKGKKNIRVESSEGLLMDYASKNQIRAVIRGLRGQSDFEYEYMMASMNKNLHPECETIFMMTSQGLYFVSSSMIKELHAFGGDIGPYVPQSVLLKMNTKEMDFKNESN